LRSSLSRDVWDDDGEGLMKRTHLWSLDHPITRVNCWEVIRGGDEFEFFKDIRTMVGVGHTKGSTEATGKTC